MCVETDTRACPCTHVHKDGHTQIHTDTYTHKNKTDMDVQVDTYTYAHTHTCVHRYTHTHILLPKGRDRHKSTHTPTLHTLPRHTCCGQPCGGECAWEEEAPLPTQHRFHPLQSVAFPQRQKIGLMLFIIIIISNITCSSSKQDPDVLGVCGRFSELCI